MPEKKPYTVPTLSVLGTVADLTRGTNGSKLDGNGTFTSSKQPNQ